MKKNRKAKLEKLSNQQVFHGRVQIKKNLVLFKLPKTILKDLELEDRKIYGVCLDGVIQITAKCPNCVIPMLIVDKESFISQ